MIKRYKFSSLLVLAFGFILLAFWGGREYIRKHPRFFETYFQGNKQEAFHSTFGVIDSVGVYQKNGQIECHGLSVFQKPVGPIKTSGAQFDISNDLAMFVWFPDKAEIPSDTSLYIKISATDLKFINKIYIGIKTNKGLFLFGNTNKKIDTKNLNIEYPKDIIQLSQGAVEKWEPYVTKAHNRALKMFNIETSQYLTQTLKKCCQDRKIECPDRLTIKAVFIIMNDLRGEQINIDSFSIGKKVLKTPPQNEEGQKITGVVKGRKTLVGDYVYLRTEGNKVVKSQLSLDGRFVFPNIPTGSVVSIWFPHQAMDYYTHLGRWFEVTPESKELTIDLTPTYINMTGAFPVPNSYKFIQKKKEAPQQNDYEPHVRMAWHGISLIQSYESFPFTNNLGYLDRDRRAENPCGCLRIVQFGSSFSQALQVKTCEKFNILLEQELGVRLGRCVEVISVARDNGDIGTHFKRLKYFIEELKPDLIMFENAPALMMQMQPELLKRLLGVDFHHNIFPHFYYDKKRRLRFAEVSPDHAFYMQKTDPSPLKDDVPLMDSLSVPFDVMHPAAKDSWSYLKDVMQYYQKLYPHQKFSLHTGVVLAQFQQPCQPKISSGGYAYGPMEFLKNHDIFCQKENILSFNIDLDKQYNQPETPLTFLNDGHPTIRGHQWCAKELARVLEAYFRGRCP